jgi:hypothetical protein
MNDTAQIQTDQQSYPRSLHPAWLAFIRFCADLKFGEIDRLSIQDGLPVLAEMTKKKVKFTNV